MRTIPIPLAMLLTLSTGCGGGPTEPTPQTTTLAEGRFSLLVSEATPPLAVPFTVSRTGTLEIRVTWTTPGPTRAIFLVFSGTCTGTDPSGCGENPVVESSETDGDTTAMTRSTSFPGGNYTMLLLVLGVVGTTEDGTYLIQHTS